MSQKITTLDDICKYLEKMDMTGYINSRSSLTVTYCVVDKKTGDSGTEYKTFTGETATDIYKKISKWVKNKSLWVKQSKLLLINDPSDPFDIDLEYELLQLGFKMAEVSYEYTNFVEVWVTYCYKDKSGRFRYDGGMIVTDIGDKFETFNYLKKWIEENPKFIPCRNKV